MSNTVTFSGHIYGRKMAHGSINALLGVTSGIASCKRRVEKTLHQVAPTA